MLLNSYMDIIDNEKGIDLDDMKDWRYLKEIYKTYK